MLLSNGTCFIFEILYNNESDNYYVVNIGGGSNLNISDLSNYVIDRDNLYIYYSNINDVI